MLRKFTTKRLRFSRRRGIVYLALLGLLALVFSCARSGERNDPPSQAAAPTPQATWTPTPIPPTPTPTPTPARRDLILGLTLPEDTLNPLQLPYDDPAARFLVDALFDRLMPPDPTDGHLTPGIVRSWAMDERGQAITLTVRTDARWHDGAPVTAEDVAFTIRAAIDPALNSPYFIRLTHIQTAEAISPSTVVVRLKEPSCSDLTGLGDLPVVPAHQLQTGTRAWDAFGRASLGSGPLRFADWQGEGRFTLVATGAHWRGSPQITRWEVRSLPPDELRKAWDAGALDAAILPRELALAPPPAWSAQWTASLEYVGVFFNLERLGLSDPRVRQALTLALDRSQINRQALQGRGLPLSAPWLPTFWAVAPAPPPPSSDPARARALLDEAGWRDTDGDGWRERAGDPLIVRIKTNGENPVRRDLAMLVAAAYRAIGVPAEVEIVPYPSLIDALFRHDYDVAIFGWPIDLDPDQSAYWRSDETEPRRGFNLVSWQDARTDELLQAGQFAPRCAPDARRVAYQALAQHLATQRPVDFLFALPMGIVTRPGLQGVTLSPFTGPEPSWFNWHW